MTNLVLILALLVLVSATQAETILEKDIHYGPEGHYHGFLARPSGEGPFPGLVVIHEWWGLNDNIRNEARKLARAGYVALAVDLFDKTTSDPKVAAQMVQGLDQKAATAKLLAATAYLRLQTIVDAERVGSMGWCFGGAQSLNLAVNDPMLAAAVIYYGRLVTDPAQLARVRAPILGIFGEADDSIPLDQVRAFDRALTEAKVVHEIHTYPGAGHAFANPSGGSRYKADAAKDAWTKTMVFLRKHLGRARR